MPDFKIHQIPVWEDNYIYVLHEKTANKIAAIDPGDATSVRWLLKKENLNLDYILITHHHRDHTGGNLELKKEWACKIYGYGEDQKRIPGIDKTLKEGDSFSIGNLDFEVLFVPGHTLGHIAFWNKKNNLLFCGDTLFAMGCGRLFEGSPEQMFTSLGKIKKLPEKTWVYCAHEYTLKNANFALTVDSTNKELKKRREKIKTLRQKKKSTVPFQLKEELLTNPFLRAESVRDFAKIRDLRDQF